MKLMTILTLVALIGTVSLPFSVADPECSDLCEDAIGISIDPDEAAQLAFELERFAKYTALRQVFTEEELDEFDASQRQYDRVVDVDVSLIDEPSAFNDEYSEVWVAEEIAKEATRAGILKNVIQIAEGATPSLNTWVHMREQSNDEDFWTFYASVRLYDSGTSLVGQTSEVEFMEDERFWTDNWQGVLELALAEANPDLTEVTSAKVDVRVLNCHYGWFSGKFKGCDSGFDTDNILVEILDLV